MKQDALLKARKSAIDDFLTEGDEEYEIAIKAIDTFLDYLEKDGINEIIVTTTGSAEYTSLDTYYDDHRIDGQEEER